MKKITYLFLLLTVSIGYSQQVVLEDFEGTPTFSGFEGLGGASIEADPASGPNGQVLELISSSAGQPWQGAELIIQSSLIDLSTDKTVKVDVYSNAAFTMFAKVEDKINTSASPASAADEAHSGSGWETLTFTFNESLDGTAAANGTYSQIAFFPNWNGAGWNTPAGDFTVYVDNITAVSASLPETCNDGIQNQDETGVDCGGSSCAPCAVPPSTAAPTPPARNASDVISLFSNAYANIAIDTWSAAWDDSDIEDIQVAGNDTKKITFTNFIGVDFQSSRFNATSFTHFHIDMYTTTPTLDKSFNLKFSNWAGGSGEANAIEFSTTNASNPALPNPNPGTWISLDMPLSSWTPGAREDLVQFLITSNLGVVYVDNIYVYKGNPLGLNDFDLVSFKVYPNPARDSWTIRTKNEDMSSIQVFDILGKNVLSLAPNASEVKIDASSLTTGLYFAQIKTSTGVNSVKLVKQ